MTAVSQLYFKRFTANFCLNNIILYNILGILYMYKTLFFQQNSFWSLPWEKGDNSYEVLDGSDTQTKSARVKMRVSESEAWLPKIIILLINLFCNIVFRQLTSKRLQHDGKPKIPKDEGLYLFKREPVYGRSKIDFTHLLLN